MKFIHVADVHLGAVPDKGYPWSEERAEEILQTFRRLLKRVREEEADLLLIAGDLFHRRPTIGELREVRYLFSRIAPTKVVLIFGNHDCLSSKNPCRNFDWGENVTVLDGRNVECAVFPELNTYVYGRSFETEEISEPLYDSMRPLPENGCHILLAHGGDALHAPMDRKKLLEQGFDYIALGHIHKPACLKENRMYYAGALEPIDRNDTGKHGYIRGEYRNGRMVIGSVPFACREYKEVEFVCSLETTEEQLAEEAKKLVDRLGTQHMYRFRLTGYRAVEQDFRPEILEKICRLSTFSDETVPDIDFEGLRKAHAKDALGRYLGALLKPGEDVRKVDPVRRRALYCGIEELLRK